MDVQRRAICPVEQTYLNQQNCSLTEMNTSRSRAPGAYSLEQTQRESTSPARDGCPGSVTLGLRWHQGWAGQEKSGPRVWSPGDVLNVYDLAAGVVVIKSVVVRMAVQGCQVPAGGQGNRMSGGWTMLDTSGKVQALEAGRNR